MSKETEEAIRNHFSELGKKGGAVNKKKGSAYFKYVRSHSKRNPVKGKESNDQPTE